MYEFRWSGQKLFLVWIYVVVMYSIIMFFGIWKYFELCCDFTVLCTAVDKRSLIKFKEIIDTGFFAGLSKAFNCVGFQIRCKDKNMQSAYR